MASLAQPVAPGADVGLEVAAAALCAGPAPELAQDAAHRHVAGQKHGVDDRGQGLRDTCPFSELRPARTIWTGPQRRHSPLGSQPLQGVGDRDPHQVVRGQALEHHVPLADPGDPDWQARGGEVVIAALGLTGGHGRSMSAPFQGGEFDFQSRRSENDGI